MTQPEEEDYFSTISEAKCYNILFPTTDINASVLYDSYNAKYIPRPFVLENTTHTTLTPMGINALGRK